MEFDYKLATRVESFGETELELTTLADLNQTIDLVFDELSKTGDQARLESLCPYFGVIWPSARGLAQWLMQLKQIYGETGFSGVRVLEIGCGLAIPSLLLAKLGADVLATDCHPDVPDFLRLNREKNLGPDVRLRYRDLNWLDLTQISEKFPLIIGSDILYESQHPGLVARALTHYLAVGGRLVIADPGRPYLQTFVTEMEGLGFSYRLDSVTVPDFPGTKDIFIFAFSKTQT